MIMRSRALFLHASALAAASAVALAAWAAPTVSESDVRFNAKGPAGLNIDGSAGAVVATQEGTKLRLGVSAQTLDTQIALRNEHLRKYLGASTHPIITLTVDRSTLKTPGDGETVESSATGELSLNGVTKPTKFTYKAMRSGNAFKVQGLMDVDIRDHKVEVPCYLGVCVDPHVKVKVKFKLTE